MSLKEIISRNLIKFKIDNLIYYQTIDGDERLTIFNRNYMNIYLERFHETLNYPVSYDDICFISVNENHDQIINDLPRNLTELFVKSSMCTELIIPDNTAENILLINFDKTNMNIFPDISQCRQLTNLILNRSNLNSFLINYELPQTLMKLNLAWNLFNNNSFNFNKINRNFSYLNLNNNHFNYNTIPLNIRDKQPFLQQGTYVFNRITFNNVANENIRNFVQNIRNTNIPNTNFATTIFTGQSVHLSSVNKSVVKSVTKIDEWINKRECYVKNITIKDVREVFINNNRIIENETIVENEIISNFSFLNALVNLFNIQNYNKNGNKNGNNIIDDINNNNIDVNDTKILDFLEKKFNMADKHTILKLTYKKLFEKIWCVAINHPEKKDIIDRLKIELLDSIGFCFTGIMNRLVNSLVGFIDGVNVGISVKEEIQLSMQQIINKLINKKIEYIDAMREVEGVFKDIPKDENITEEYKNVWIEALKDYEPEPIIVQLINPINLHDR